MEKPIIKLYVYISSAWVELNDVAPARVFWGMSDNRPSTRLADVGELLVALDNSTGLYTPGADTALAGWKKGLPVKMVVTFEGEDFVRFRGTITDIKIRPSHKDKRAYITVSDWMDYAARHPIINPGVQTDKRADEMLTTILGDVEVAPQAQSIGTGTETFPIVFDTVTGNVTSYSEIAKAVTSELGYAYVKKDRTNGETFVFEGSDARHGWVEPNTRALTTYTVTPNPGSLLLEDGSYLLLEDGGKLVLDESTTNNYTFDGTLDGSLITNFDAVYGEHVINRMSVTVNPRIISNGFNPQTLIIPLLEDYHLASEDPTSNFDSETSFGIGEWNAGSATRRSIVTPDFSTLPDGVVFHSVKLKLFPISPDQSSNSRTMRAHRVLRGAINGSATWNTYNGVDSWGTAGCSNSTTDYDGAIELGNMSVPASPTLNSALEMEFSEAGVEEFQKMYDGTYENRGIILFVDTQTDDLIYYASRENSDANLHPCFVITFSRNILFKLDEEIIIPPQNSFTLKGKYANPEGGNPIAGYSMTTPVATTDYTMFSSTGGTGTDLTSDLDVSISFGSEGFTAVLTNTNSSAGYVNKFNTRGVGIYRYSQVESSEIDSSSISEHGTEEERINQAYKTTLYHAKGFAETVVDEFKNPKTVLNSVSFVANKSSGCMLAFLYTDVGDMVYIDAPEIGVQANHYIQGVEFEINGGVVMVKWTLIAALSLQVGLSPIAIEFAGGTATDRIVYNNVNKINNLPSTRTWSAWIYPNSLASGTDANMIMYTYGTAAMGFYIYDQRIYLQAPFSTTTGIWRTNQNPFTTGGWRLITITYDNSSTSNDPIIYINGSSVTVNETSTPVGTPRSLEGANTYIGNWLNVSTGSFIFAFDGKIFDPRVYNRILSAAEVTTLYNSGTPDVTLVTDGLVFQGFNVKTSELSSYTDVTLTSSLKVRDNAYGAIGTPSGSPIGRTAP